MSALFWHFVFYSFFGYLVEKLFACAVRSPHQVRRCCLVLPLCPVYGHGMLAVLAGPEALLRSPLLPLWGAFAATAVEYTMHLFYERALGVRFWDYTGQPGNLGGRVCLPFSLAWGVLTAAAAVYLEPWVERASQQPMWLTAAFAAALAWDGGASARVLHLTGDIDALGLTPPERGKT